MIIIKVFQGLGNQLFQYALARSLSVRHGVEVKLDLSWYHEHSSHRAFGLDRFHTVYMEANENECYNVRHGIFANRIRNFFFRRSIVALPYFKQPYFKEDLSKFDPNILEIDSRTYVEGYFSSEVFFKEIRSLLKEELTLKKDPDATSVQWIKQMQQEESVCLSIRRGDFVNNPLHDVCDLEYFEEGVARFREILKAPVFYIFSDDNDWVKANLKIKEKHHFITHNFPDYYEDFRLMQACKHHLIPNSTFSWWAAWLSDHPEKKVIAPRTWLNTEHIDYSYFLPEEWIKIDNFKA